MTSLSGTTQLGWGSRFWEMIWVENRSGGSYADFPLRSFHYSGLSSAFGKDGCCSLGGSLVLTITLGLISWDRFFSFQHWPFSLLVQTLASCAYPWASHCGPCGFPSWIPWPLDADIWNIVMAVDLRLDSYWSLCGLQTVCWIPHMSSTGTDLLHLCIFDSVGKCCTLLL